MKVSPRVLWNQYKGLLVEGAKRAVPLGVLYATVSAILSIFMRLLFYTVYDGRKEMRAYYYWYALPFHQKQHWEQGWNAIMQHVKQQ